MFKPPVQIKRSRYTSSDRGKNFCWSIPFHRMNVLEDVERNAHMEMCSSQSQYLIRLVDRDTALKKKQIEEHQSELRNLWEQK